MDSYLNSWWYVNWCALRVFFRSSRLILGNILINKLKICLMFRRDEITREFKTLPSEGGEGRFARSSIWDVAAAEDWPGNFFFFGLSPWYRVTYAFSHWLHLWEMERRGRYWVYRLVGRSWSVGHFCWLSEGHDHHPAKKWWLENTDERYREILQRLMICTSFSAW